MNSIKVNINGNSYPEVETNCSALPSSGEKGQEEKNGNKSKQDKKSGERKKRKDKGLLHQRG